MKLYDEKKAGRHDKLDDLTSNFQLLFVVRHTRLLSIRGAAERLGFSPAGVRLGLRRLRLNIRRQIDRMDRAK
jgi:DNA-directed RNA polymerase specialized sigma24 family protein